MKSDSLFIGALCLGALSALSARFSPVLADGWRSRFFLPVSAVLRVLPGFLSVTVLILAAAALLSVRRLGFKRALARMLCLGLVPYWLLWAPLYSCSALAPRIIPSSDMLSDECLRLIDVSNALLAAPSWTLPQNISEDTMQSAEHLVSSLCGQNLRLSRRDLANSPAGALLSGVYLPLSGLSYINSDDIWIMLPFTMCHELAHQGGYAREDEAGYIAWKACEAGDILFRLSGSFNMLLYGMELLSVRSPALWQSCVYAMSDTLYALFVRCNGLHTAPETVCYRLSQALSALFLRMNSQEASYESAFLLKMALNGLEGQPA